MTPLPVLYSFRRCPYAMRARLALAAAGIAVELREILLKAKPAAMLEASAKGTVPVLVLADGRVVDESLDVMRWALQQQDPLGWLDEADSGQSQELLHSNDGPFKHWLDLCKYSVRFPEHSMEHYRAEALQILLDWNLRIASHGGALLGPQRRLADWALLPFVRQFAMIDTDWFATAPVPELRAWLQQGLASPLFASIMPKFPLWEQQSSPGVRVDWTTTPA